MHGQLLARVDDTIRVEVHDPVADDAPCGVEQGDKDAEDFGVFRTGVENEGVDEHPPVEDFAVDALHEQERIVRIGILYGADEAGFDAGELIQFPFKDCLIRRKAAGGDDRLLDGRAAEANSAIGFDEADFDGDAFDGKFERVEDAPQTEQAAGTNS